MSTVDAGLEVAGAVRWEACACLAGEVPDGACPAGGLTCAKASAAGVIARSGQPRTDSAMRTYIENQATGPQPSSAMGRKLPSIAPDSIPAGFRTSRGTTAPIVAIAFEPTSIPALDGVVRVPSFARCDRQHRINVGKATAPLGWTPATALVATCNSGRVSVIAAPKTSPAQQCVTLDDKGRLRMGPAASAILRLDPTAQVLAIAVPVTGELVLMPAAAALEVLTGPVTMSAPATPSAASQVTAPEQGAPRSAVRSRFRPQVVA
jgi:hypothetical protein